ncbi:hypothetical protein F934_02929 [Acinetobacter beijerinckii ANC 3835]|uniref:Uncharacterized protein n=1 Tax=Acinetobacter beijerinckii ANC 3835 TaxID=1217649 RepID=N9F627_9GAMM|nr:hypothetical protein F934_02929 [Acinetobacter beijerinckii ANC 3835]
MTSIQAKALCLFRQNDKVLLAKAYDTNKDEHFSDRSVVVLNLGKHLFRQLKERSWKKFINRLFIQNCWV